MFEFIEAQLIIFEGSSSSLIQVPKIHNSDLTQISMESRSDSNISDASALIDVLVEGDADPLPSVDFDLMGATILSRGLSPTDPVGLLKDLGFGDIDALYGQNGEDREESEEGEEDEIIVIGEREDDNDIGDDPHGDEEEEQDNYGDTDDEADEGNEDPGNEGREDSDSHDVAVNIPNPTQTEQAAIDKLKADILKVGAAINALASNAQITLGDGTVVTGAELKAAWANTDFTVNPAQYNGYANRSGRGEADFNGGNPEISLNIDVIQAYQAHQGGGNYLILHELGHFSENNNNYLSETEANDVARAIAATAGLSTYALATYSTGSPLTFTTPGG
ncbi:hypothetical protein KCG44_10330 [Pacificimonas sp. WHA3]|uniref:Uncharacterized protein n=1 Tax=Pacificimonas pallii TaxID=2827236 RepID=A0ABS6SGL2_9SPHN|nr:hypothetical protein [Pacificimonas pallii]MBV7257178.1 hypothetical protein [Pacificimonas pallii]